MFIIDKLKLDINLIGGKAYNLSILEQSGINVPKWFCISSECTENDLEELKQEIEQYLSRNFDSKDTFSVRSSGLAEDGGKRSYAGQFETFLNVKQEDLIKNIKKCWKSAHNKNIKLYAGDLNNVKMGVIIQKMIVPKISGILFTANPNGLLNEMVVVAGAGQGSNVVEDKVPVCTYYYNKTDKISYFEKQNNAEELNSKELDEIIEVGNKIHDIYKTYVDVEWCIKEDKLYILQARPITTINTKDIVILDNSNIVESYPNITLPLTQSFVKEAYYRVFKGAFTRLVKNKKVITNNDKYLREMLGVTNGRVYYKITNWYTFIDVLPFNKKIIPIWQEMMGVSNKEVVSKKQKVGFLTHVFVTLNSAYLLITVNSKMRKLNKFFLEIPEYFDKNFKPKMDNIELIKLYDILAEKLVKDWDITLCNDMNTFIFTGLVKNKFKKMGVKDYAISTNKYISGLAGIDSMIPVKELIKISKFVANDSKLLQELKGIKTNEDFYKYITHKSENEEVVFIDSLKYYIKEFGDRSIEELKLESQTFAISPILLIEKIIQYAENNEKLDSIEQNFATLKKMRVKKSLLLNFYTKRAIDGIKNREISRLNRSRIYGMIRKIFLHVGQNLYENGKIEEKEDVFYLYSEEVQKVANNIELDLKSIVLERKMQYEKYNHIPAYSRLVFSGEPFDKNILDVNMFSRNDKADKLYGTPCSSGIVEGEVVIVEDPKNVTNIEGKILVTKMTDPGWVFLLTMAKGIISEKGSLLSHTAIISRELNVPSVVRY